MKTRFCGDIALEQDIDIVSSKFVEGLVVHRADVSVSLQFRYRTGIKSVDNERTDWSRHSWALEQLRQVTFSTSILFRRCLRMLIRCSCTIYINRLTNTVNSSCFLANFLFIYSFFFFFSYLLYSFILIYEFYYFLE